MKQEKDGATATPCLTLVPVSRSRNNLHNPFKNLSNHFFAIYNLTSCGTTILPSLLSI